MTGKPCDGDWCWKLELFSWQSFPPVLFHPFTHPLHYCVCWSSYYPQSIYSLSVEQSSVYRVVDIFKVKDELELRCLHSLRLCALWPKAQRKEENVRGKFQPSSLFTGMDLKHVEVDFTLLYWYKWRFCEIFLDWSLRYFSHYKLYFVVCRWGL